MRAIEERSVRPVGADQERKVDVRILAASPSDLSVRVASGTFRPDLFYRLSVVRVTLPPLRGRREDIGPIVAEILRRRGFPEGTVSGPNLDRLYAHPFPGNVRELRNIVDRALALSPGAASFADLRLSVSLTPAGDEVGLAIRTDLPYVQAKQAILDNFEVRYLRDVLARSQGNISAAARASGLDRKHLRNLLRRHGLVGQDAPDE